MARRAQIEDLVSVAVPEQPALSPDGRGIAYVLRAADQEQDRVTREIWLAGDNGTRRLTRGPADTAPAWSPDGEQLAFLRGGDGPAQVWLLPAGGGEAEAITELPQGAGAPVWSPDGTKIAFAAVVSTTGAGASDPIVTERLDYQADGAGWLRDLRKHLFVLDVESRATRQVTEGDWHAGDPAWSPDGQRLAFSATDTDLVFRAPLNVIDVTGPKARPRVVGLADGVAGPAVWSPRGDALVVVGYEDSPVGHARLLHVPLDGGPVRDLAASLDRNVMPGGPAYPGAVPRFTADGENVLFCVRDRGCSHLYTVSLSGKEPRPVVAGAGRVVSGLSVAGGTAAITLATPTSYSEIVSIDLSSGAETVRTGHNESDIELFERAEREFTISDGTVVQGWLIRDPDVTGARPLLLDIHGGPHNAWNGAADDVHLYHQELVAAGWNVLLLNPRASDGYGERFFTAALGAWGVADARDFLEPLDQLVAEGLADPRKLAVAGYSYGGYMTCYLTATDDRFAAAVAGGVVSDLTSMAGSSDDGHLLAEIELGGYPWDSPERYAAMSPLARVADVTTPTLVIQGAADLRCPVGQAQQWHTALRERGVPTELVLYPEGSHLLIVEGPPSQRIDFNRRTAEWVRRHTGTGRKPLDAAHWQRRLDVLAERHGLPGAVLGIARSGESGGTSGDELVEAAYGVLNADTGVETTAESVFQIGSISKVWTATLVMQLVDEGKLELDAPIAEVLPELTLAEAGVAAKVTMRHLLTHTSGIDGDVFTDTGRGDDCLEKYVGGLRDVAQNHPLGATWSYCNSGFSLAGRVIEKLTGGTWDAAVRERIIGPLGLRRTGTLPEEALLHRAAAGHVPGPQVAPVWMLPRALGPAGLINSTAADLLAFARMHLDGGGDVLSAASAAAMAGHQVELPEKFTLGDSWGLGWIRFDWDGHRLIGHDGNTIGQSAFLRLLPEQGLAVTLLTNGEGARDLYQELFTEIFAEVAGVAMPQPLTPPSPPADVDITEHLGTYERASMRLEVLEGPLLRMTQTGPLAELSPEPVHQLPLVGVREDLFLVRMPESDAWFPVYFYRLPTGERYLHLGVRATPKVA
ncbi:serine hydrolase [Paractinoplanes brasiliensis]|uniref:Dipeptidyl aminopeptidase/acylaminoacyl peptidase n=1 Tax=Paractinoplanes brasiliensis TaxID=52695 RepID=A0A4R6JDB7_9ACTN|nr:serine hydrolase [Actinoplanes brasiliensis]TDO32961.1 dipeptidyl aminopeptidase/acylaminoacyl peptidase [Actinoplanes brasiliensis]GID28679.1 serine hydrolase [Actinoplanes brasiliensis]